MAQDRELRHITDARMSWRWSDRRQAWYPWCRVCSRDASQQVDRLNRLGYVFKWDHRPISQSMVLFTGLACLYMERYPR